MIYLTRLNHSSLVLNCDLIEHVEMTPDTVVSLTTGQKFVVLETADEIIERVKDYRRSILTPCPAASFVRCLDDDNHECPSGDDLDGRTGA